MSYAAARATWWANADHGASKNNGEPGDERELVVWGFYPSKIFWAFIGSTLPASDLFPMLD